MPVQQTQPGAAAATPSAKPESEAEMMDRHMSEVRRRVPGINQTLRNEYGLSQADLNGFAADINCNRLDDARAILENALARKRSLKVAS